MTNSIILGAPSSPIASFFGASIETVTGHSAVDIISDSLSIDTLDPDVRYTFIAPEIYKPTDAACIVTTDGKIYCGHFEGMDLVHHAPWGTPLQWYRGGKLRGQYYVDTVEQAAPTLWRIRAMSLVGILDKQKHKGRVYTGQSWISVLQEIIGGSAGSAAAGYIPLTGGLEDCLVAEELAAVKVYGWLPYDWSRSNLHKLLLSAGASMTRDENAKLVFRYIKSEEPAAIEAQRIFLEGGGVRMDAAATGVEVTEHVYQWAYNTNPATLYDNTNAYAEPADHETVTFSNPVKVSSRTIEGSLTIHEMGENYAVVSGKGILRAIPYVHLTRRLSRHTAATTPGKVVSFNDCTLISVMNSERALERLFNFCTAARAAQADLKAETERTGHFYSFNNSVGRSSRGVLNDMDFVSGANLKARSSFVTDFTPGPFGNNYNEVKLFTGSGSWTVPTWLRQSKFPFIRVTLVGAGNGGEGGQGGQSGRGMWSTTGSQVTGRGSGPGGKGGKGGKAGEGGRILTVARLDLSNIASIRYRCGSGGSAGRGGTGGSNETARLPGAGGTGGDTVIELINDAGAVVATYTTANGAVLPSGVANLATSEVYGLSGKDGQRAGNGGEGGTASASADGGEGESITVDGVTWPGGKGSKAAYAQQSTQFGTMVAECGGGGGSGAAYGTPGKDSHQAAIAAWMIASEGGHGGHGVMAAFTPQAATTYGQGGDGGHGGSGGGSGGAQNNVPVQDGIQDGWPGSGANGTVGAAGAPGCVFFYIGQEEAA